MIDTISLKVSQWIKEKNPSETASVEVMRYSLNIILNTVSIILLCVTIGYSLDIFYQTLLVMISFAVLRSFSGGYHIKSSEWCIAISTGMIISLSYISKYFDITDLIIICNTISILLVYLFAPAKIYKQTRIPKKYYPLLKILSIILVGLNFYFMSSALALSYLVQSTTLIHKKEVKTE